MAHAAHFLHHLVNAPTEDPFGDWQGPGWYFVDESEARLYGPHPDEETCREARDAYFVRLHS